MRKLYLLAWSRWPPRVAAVAPAARRRKLTTTSRCRSRPVCRRRRRWGGTAGTSSRATSTMTFVQGHRPRDGGQRHEGRRLPVRQHRRLLVAGRRAAAEGSLQHDPARFPQGIKPVADFVHGLGLKLGIYGDRGIETCGHRAGSEDHEVAGRDDVRVVGGRLPEVRQLPRSGAQPGADHQPHFEAMRDGAGRQRTPDRVQRLRLVVLRMGDAHRPPAAHDDRHQEPLDARSQFGGSRLDHHQPEDQPAARRLRRAQPVERSRHARGRQQRQRRRLRHRRREPEPLQPVGDHRRRR